MPVEAQWHASPISRVIRRYPIKSRVCTVSCHIVNTFCGFRNRVPHVKVPDPAPVQCSAAATYQQDGQ